MKPTIPGKLVYRLDIQLVEIGDPPVDHFHGVYQWEGRSFALRELANDRTPAQFVDELCHKAGVHFLAYPK